MSARDIAARSSGALLLVGLLVTALPSVAGCEPGPAGSAIWVPAPSGFYWAENPHAGSWNTIGVIWGEGAYVQPYNYQVGSGGPCVAGFADGLGPMTSDCPWHEEGRYGLGTFVIPLPLDGTHWSNGNLYAAGSQHSIRIETTHDDASGRCLAVAEVGPPTEAEWEKCLTCPP